MVLQQLASQFCGCCSLEVELKHSIYIKSHYVPGLKINL